jgi:hypothetical protein
MRRKDHHAFPFGTQKYLAVGFVTLELEEEFPGFAGRSFHFNRTTDNHWCGQRFEERFVEVVAPGIREISLPFLMAIGCKAGKRWTAPNCSANCAAPGGRNGLKSHGGEGMAESYMTKRYQLIPTVKRDLSLAFSGWLAVGARGSELAMH